MTKTRFWLALTGWLPWGCYFGLHDPKTICAGYAVKELCPEFSREWLATTKYEYSHPFVFIPRAQVCKRCGTAW